MYILGVNAFHADSSSCLIKDGKLLAAAEEERFRRIKHWAGFPSKAIQWCLDDAKISLDEVDYIAVNQDSRANYLEKIKFVATKRPELSLIANKIKKRKARDSIIDYFSRSGVSGNFTGEVVNIEHHMAHLSSAFHVSPFESALAVSVDGFGDFASTAWAHCEGNEIDVKKRVYFPHSLGILYQAVTQHLGFMKYGDEYKVMGLAPYGNPTRVSDIRKLIDLSGDGTFELKLKNFAHHKSDNEQQWEDGTPNFGRLFSDNVQDILGHSRESNEDITQEHMDMAHSLQVVYEEAFFNILKASYSTLQSENLVLAGGCANNSVANGKVSRRTKFSNVYVHSAPGDQGGAIGAAFSAWHKLEVETNHDFVMNHAYWGPQYSTLECSGIVKKAESDGQIPSNLFSIETLEEAALVEYVASKIASGNVIGWFQGRMEWGPRALGNRSILCDPRRADMKEILNVKIKRRESFRPFAPSILREEVSEWFEEDADVPFMMKVFQIKEGKRSVIPAVCHADGSGRLQTVTPEINSRYYKLIKQFFESTGVPILLNTSFNENEPVVCTPQEALDCFLRTKMDVLVLGDIVITRK